MRKSLFISNLFLVEKHWLKISNIKLCSFTWVPLLLDHSTLKIFPENIIFLSAKVSSFLTKTLRQNSSEEKKNRKLFSVFFLLMIFFPYKLVLQTGCSSNTKSLFFLFFHSDDIYFRKIKIRLDNFEVQKLKFILYSLKTAFLMIITKIILSHLVEIVWYCNFVRNPMPQ
jgi:hypothetical protein